MYLKLLQICLSFGGIPITVKADTAELGMAASRTWSEKRGPELRENAQNNSGVRVLGHGEIARQTNCVTFHYNITPWV